LAFAATLSFITFAAVTIAGPIAFTAVIITNSTIIAILILIAGILPTGFLTCLSLSSFIITPFLTSHLIVLITPLNALFRLVKFCFLIYLFVNCYFVQSSL
jgi:hypothetical protein